MQDKTHNQKVSELKQVLLDLNLPVLPLNTVKSDFYVPDVITRVDAKFIVMDFINSKERVPFDIGGLAVIRNKDIVEGCIAIIDNNLWEENLRAFRLAKLNLLFGIKMMPFKEVKEYFIEEMRKKELWGI